MRLIAGTTFSPPASPPPDIHHDRGVSARNLHDRSSPKPISSGLLQPPIAAKKLKFLPNKATAAGSPSIPSANVPIRGARVPGCREETVAGQCAGHLPLRDGSMYRLPA